MYVTRLRVRAELYYFSGPELSWPQAEGAVTGPNPRGLHGGEEMRAAWMGHGARSMGLAGSPAQSELAALLAGSDPSSGERLRSSRARVSIAGWDLTFGAPKVASLLWALCEPTEAATVLGAHRRAVEDAVGHLERYALRARRREGKVERVVEISGAIGACFAHEVSRSGDPHLHTHVVLANLAHARDDRWSALDSRWLYREAVATGLAYRSQLLRDLDRAGIWDAAARRPRGDLDLKPELMDSLSTRRADVARRLLQWKAQGPSASRAAALATRSAKSELPSPSSLRDRWWATARAHGVSDTPRSRSEPVRAPTRALEEAPSGRDVAGPGGPFGAGGPMDEALRRSVASAGGPTGRFREEDLVAALCRDHEGRLGVREAEELALEALRRSIALPMYQRVPGPSPRGGQRWYQTEEAALAQRKLDSLSAARRREGGVPSGKTPVGLRELSEIAAPVALVTLDGPVASTYDVLARSAMQWISEGGRVVGLAKSPWSAAAAEGATGIPFAAAGSRLPRCDTVVVLAAQTWGPMELSAVFESPSVRQILLLGTEWSKGGAWRQTLERVTNGTLHPLLLEWGEESAVTKRPSSVQEIGTHKVVLSESPVAVRRAVSGDLLEAMSAGRPGLALVSDHTSAGLLTREVREAMRAGGLLARTATVGRTELAEGDFVRLWRPYREVGSRKVLLVESTSRESTVLRDPDGVAWRLGNESLERAGIRHCYALTPAEARRLGVVPEVVQGGAELAREASGDLRHEAAHRYHVVHAVESWPWSGSRSRPWSAEDSRAARAAEVSRAPYVISEIGEPPGGLSSREPWARAAAAIVRFRERWRGVEPPERDRAAHRAWQAGAADLRHETSLARALLEPRDVPARSLVHEIGRERAQERRERPGRIR